MAETTSYSEDEDEDQDDLEHDCDDEGEDDIEEEEGEEDEELEEEEESVATPISEDERIFIKQNNGQFIALKPSQVMYHAQRSHLISIDPLKTGPRNRARLNSKESVLNSAGGSSLYENSSDCLQGIAGGSGTTGRKGSNGSGRTQQQQQMKQMQGRSQM